MLRPPFRSHAQIPDAGLQGDPVSRTHVFGIFPCSHPPGSPEYQVAEAAVSAGLGTMDKEGHFQKGSRHLDLGKESSKGETPHGPTYIPTPEFTPPPVANPFPPLATSPPPSTPKWNVPKANLAT
ncbi:uncharacterized protein MAM_08135 [Metarhizium album ARSEF 1941]|uniref:Uncharacterized protein n=1 Tax=Metarhizium album (strain ARSEF 1941) TaxID=1081103 RepID=A0A0B2WDQ3_METAS|nr:uncharacterized protein MAM_08135 [Metarhizium album ARSEF 1941]KHN94006.1 hypothetical protein MAM_08135 [Metarhizium album ARSEF 1941]